MVSGFEAQKSWKAADCKAVQPKSPTHPTATVFFQMKAKIAN